MIEQQLERIANALEKMAGRVTQDVAQDVARKREPKKRKAYQSVFVEEAETAAVEEAETVEVEEARVFSSEFKYETLRTRIVDMASQGGVYRRKVEEVLGFYGVKKATELAAELWEEAYERLGQ